MSILRYKLSLIKSILLFYTQIRAVASVGRRAAPHEALLPPTMGFPPASLGGRQPPKFLKNNFQWSQPPPQFWAVLNTLFS